MSIVAMNTPMFNSSVALVANGWFRTVHVHLPGFRFSTGRSSHSFLVNEDPWRPPYEVDYQGEMSQLYSRDYDRDNLMWLFLQP